MSRVLNMIGLGGQSGGQSGLPTGQAFYGTGGPGVGRYQVPPIDRFAQEVANGLPNCQKRLNDAMERKSWYDFDNERFLPKREAESDFDFESRPKRVSGLLRECVDILCDHLYNPGPNRSVKDNDEADEFLQKVYEQNLFNHLMQEADILSSLNQVAAIQIDAGEGLFEERPLDLLLWGAEEFHAWTHPRNPRQVVAVVTLDRYDEYETRRLWNAEECWTFVTEKLMPGQTSAGRVARLESREFHGYGRIPFAFTHYELPIRSFYPSCIGELLMKAQKRYDDRLSQLDEAIQKHLAPIPVAEGVGPEWNPIIEPGRFLRLCPPPFSGIGGDFSATPPPPRLSYLQVTLDIAGIWDDLLRFVNSIMEAARVPLAYARMEQSGTASGIALIVEQAPLITRAKKRRIPYAHYETEIARAILECAGNHYGVPAFLDALPTLTMNLSWPEPSIITPGPERDESDDYQRRNKITSLTMSIQERFGFSREQAQEHLKQVAEDFEDEQEILANVLQVEAENEFISQNPDIVTSQDGETPPKNEGSKT